MVDMNMIIANNILSLLKKEKKKQADLAKYLNTNRQTVNKMLNGTRMINAIELKQIAAFFSVKMEELTRIETPMQNTDVVHAFMGKVASEEAREGLKIADRLSDMIIFHRKVKENGIEMMEAWDTDE